MKNVNNLDIISISVFVLVLVGIPMMILCFISLNTNGYVELEHIMVNTPSNTGYKSCNNEICTVDEIEDDIITLFS